MEPKRETIKDSKPGTTSKPANTRKEGGEAGVGTGGGPLTGGGVGQSPGAVQQSSSGQQPGAGQPAGSGAGQKPGSGGQQSKGGQQTGAKQQQSAGQQSGAQQQPGGGEQDLMQHAKNATGEIVNQVQKRAGSQVNQQKENAAQGIASVANAMRKVGENLSHEENSPIARYAAEYGDKAAQQLDRFADYVRHQDPKRLLSDVQSFGRRRPVWLIGGAFVLGLAGARLIKSSMNAASQSSVHSGNQPFKPNRPATRQPASPNAL